MGSASAFLSIVANEQGGKAGTIARNYVPCDGYVLPSLRCLPALPRGWLSVCFPKAVPYPSLPQMLTSTITLMIITYQALDGKPLYVRVLFEESNSIAWAAQIVQIDGAFYIQQSFPSENNFLNLEKPSPYEFSTKYTLIEPNTPLYDIIMSIL